MQLEKKFAYTYPRPSLTADIAIFTYADSKLKALMIQRAKEPFKNCWALPGGFVDENEKVEDAAVRELKEETGLSQICLNQVCVASQAGRDPRGWTVSIIFVGFVNYKNVLVTAGDDARKAEWFAMDDLPKLAFDHGLIMEQLYKYLQNQVSLSVFGNEILDDKFELSSLVGLYHQILGTEPEAVKNVERLLSLSAIKQYINNPMFYFDKPKTQVNIENIHL